MILTPLSSAGVKGGWSVGGTPTLPSNFTNPIVGLPSNFHQEVLIKVPIISLPSQNFDASVMCNMYVRGK